ncbi:uncharacterized protein F4807DRAFT_463142 [Annulohypoxylon truncatum]|uniref:uncharacterized protein n=1 Tax=Annulohypoxylon truncatum TaxID=327061 RepID=UPI002007374D|nr:uncharacterized protein F4807DRAFT_463142 [Annulohypoxylon truncatum]KAI1207079.1 hypothetical protein F4807DRAFT_463142 [Annulohypoxylon truncatum]
MWETGLSRRFKHRKDPHYVVAIIRDILQSRKIPVSFQGTHDLVVPDPAPNTVICENLVGIIQDNVVSRGVFENKDHAPQIISIINKMLSPASQLRVHRMIEQAQAPGQASPIITTILKELIQKLVNAVYAAYRSEQVVMAAAAAVDNWEPILQPVTPNAIEEDNGGVEQGTAVVDGYDMVVLSLKREHDDGESSDAKRICVNTDGDDDVPKTIPRHCVFM